MRSPPISAAMEARSAVVVTTRKTEAEQGADSIATEARRTHQNCFGLIVGLQLEGVCPVGPDIESELEESGQIASPVPPNEPSLRGEGRELGWPVRQIDKPPLFIRGLDVVAAEPRPPAPSELELRVGKGSPSILGTAAFGSASVVDL